MLCRYGIAWGFVASPMIRICSLLAPWNDVTTTVTTGSRVYLLRAFSMSRARSVGLRPIACRSSRPRWRFCSVGWRWNRQRQFQLGQPELFTLSSGK